MSPFISVLMAASIASSPNLGKEEAQCRPNEPGPAFLVGVEGLKDRNGLLKVEVYPAVQGDFLADDNKLVAAGKAFRRVELRVPATGMPIVCIRVPQPGTYAVAVLHDRDANHKFGLSSDGVGFSRNPTLGWGKPRVDKVAVGAGSGLTRIDVIMNYRHGLFSFRPLGH